MTDRTPGCRYAVKQIFDTLCALAGLGVTWWIIVISYIAATIDTGQNGFFIQERIGRHGRRFKLIKLRTMRSDTGVTTCVTTSKDPRITGLGRFFRKTKIDELPQLVNVLMGDMSFVGPRPDVAGFADRLEGRDRLLLSVKPGITGPATLKYRNEENILAAHKDPQAYNRDVIFPDKVAINLEYVRNYSLKNDIHYIFKTIFP